MLIFETMTRYNYPVHHHRHLVENCQLQHVVPGETMDGETCGNCLTLAHRRFCHHRHPCRHCHRRPQLDNHSHHCHHCRYNIYYRLTHTVSNVIITVLVVNVIK